MHLHYRLSKVSSFATKSPLNNLILDHGPSPNNLPRPKLRQFPLVLFIPLLSEQSKKRSRDRREWRIGSQSRDPDPHPSPQLLSDRRNPKPNHHRCRAPSRHSSCSTSRAVSSCGGTTEATSPPPRPRNSSPN